MKNVPEQLPDEFPILLSITGKNSAGDQEEDDVIRLMTTGTMKKLSDGWQMDYTETDPDTGAQQEIRMLLRQGSVSMMRKGPYATGMVFEKEKRFEGAYHTPYGDMSLGVYATRVHWRVENGEGHVNLTYSLDLQGHFTAVHELSLRFAYNG